MRKFFRRLLRLNYEPELNVLPEAPRLAENPEEPLAEPYLRLVRSQLPAGFDFDALFRELSQPFDMDTYEEALTGDDWANSLSAMVLLHCLAHSPFRLPADLFSFVLRHAARTQNDLERLVLMMSLSGLARQFFARGYTLGELMPGDWLEELFFQPCRVTSGFAMNATVTLGSAGGLRMVDQSWAVKCVRDQLGLDATTPITDVDCVAAALSVLEQGGLEERKKLPHRLVDLPFASEVLAPIFDALLFDPSTDVRAQTTSALGASPHRIPPLVDALVRVVAEGDGKDRHCALFALATLEDPDLYHRVTDLLLQQSDLFCTMLGMQRVAVDEPKRVAQLLSFIRHPDYRLRAAALLQLMLHTASDNAHNPGILLPWLNQVITSDPDLQVRLIALHVKRIIEIRQEGS